MQPNVEEKAGIFDREGTIKSEVNEALAKLKVFRAKYPFVENPELVETLKPKDIFKSDSGEIGDFFHWIEYYLKPLGHLTVYSNVYRRIGSRLEAFKELPDDSFTICVAHNQQEATKLGEVGFGPFDVIDGVHLYRKRK